VEAAKNARPRAIGRVHSIGLPFVPKGSATLGAVSLRRGNATVPNLDQAAGAVAARCERAEAGRAHGDPRAVQGRARQRVVGRVPRV
jgi:hypothetical protein